MNHVNDALNERRNADLRREQHDLDARRSAQTLGVVAGAGTLSLPGGIRESVAGDRDAVFKAALAEAPVRTLFKSEMPTERKSDHEVASDRVTQEGRVTNLIKTAHANGQNWNPFAESQTSPIAKLTAQVGLGEHGEIGLDDDGALVVRISKAA